MEKNKTANHFALCFGKYLSDNRSALTIGIVAFLGFWLVIGIAFGLLETGGGGGEWSFYWFLSSYCAWVFASLMFGDMKSKEGRINFLMQPASADDKFWPRFIIGVIFPIVPMVAGFYIMEFGRLLGNCIIIGKWLPILQPWAFVDAFDVQGWVMLASSYIMMQSFYFFGAILWPKHSFLKSLAVIILIQIILVASLTSFWKWISPGLIIEIDEMHAEAIVIAITSVTAFVFCRLAFLRLRRSTVVYRLRQ